MLVDQVTYQLARSGAAFNRDPDGVESGAFVLHAELAAGGEPRSPGLRADGSAWVRFDWAGWVGINEVLPDPEGADNDQEFVEIVNASTFTTDLEGWTLADGREVRHVFAAGRRLAPGDADGEVVDVVSWASSRSGVSLNRSPDGDPDSPFVPHDTAAGATGSSSPGTRADGSAFEERGPYREVNRVVGFAFARW